MSDTPDAVFEQVADTLSGGRTGVDRGKMMSAPGIRYDGKVFAFLWRDAMVFRLGRQYDPAADGLAGIENLNPFKNKPPMKDWFVIPADHQVRWPDLADAALAHMVKERG